MATFSEVQFYCSLFFVWFLSTLLVRFLATKHRRSKTKLRQIPPPSPPALPIIGHLHLLGSVLPKSLQTLSSRYGPIMQIHTGASSSIVVSNAAVAKEILKKNELIFVSRPEIGSSDYDIYKGPKFIMGDYGPYWRFMKKICMTELLSAQQINRFVDIRKQEVVELLENLALCSEEGKACNIGDELMRMTNNMICRMAMSARCWGNGNQSDKIREFVKESTEIVIKLSLGEILGPFLKKFDLFGYGKRRKALLMKFDSLVEMVMVEHEQKKKKRNGDETERGDMMNILLNICEDESAEVKLTRNDIKSFFLEIFMAGTETMSVGLRWTVAELINHPNVFNKLRDEINTVVGPTSLVQESDVPKLPYLQAVVEESLRLHPPAPLILRRCRENCKINGYDILDNDRIMINLYAVMRDPESWDRPAEFVPERFLAVRSMEKHDGRQVNVVDGRDFNYLPFGSGRRGCTGEALASRVMHVTIAALVQCFDFKIKGEGKLDMEEGPGFSASMAHPIVCYPLTRVNPFEISIVMG